MGFYPPTDKARPCNPIDGSGPAVGCRGGVPGSLEPLVRVSWTFPGCTFGSPPPNKHIQNLTPCLGFNDAQHPIWPAPACQPSRPPSSRNVERIDPRPQLKARP